MDTKTGKIKDSLSKGLDWIDQNQKYFKLTSLGTSSDAKIKAVKPIGELVLAANLLSNWNIEKPWAERQLNHSWASLEEGGVLLQMLLARPDLIVISTVYASFKENGFVNTKLNRLISFLSSTACCLSIEFPRWRQLDLEHGLSALDLKAFPSDAHLGTWISGLPEPWLLTDDIAYAVTHEVFYITDFGNRPDNLPQDIRAYVSRWLNLWIKMYLERSNFDLIAEFVMVGLCVGLEDKMQDSILLLIQAQHDDGYFLGPGIIPNTPSPEKIFFHNYHTTLVSLLAISMFIRFGPTNAFSGHA